MYHVETFLRVDCESKLIDSILYELNMWDDFDNVEVIITESEVIK